MTEQIQPTPAILYCANHPDRETGLRCKRCDKPICTQCARLTPVGYICPECLRSQQKTFDTARWMDYPLAIVISGVLAYLGSLLAGRLGFLTLFLAPIVGVGIAEVVRWVVRRRRSLLLFKLSTIAVVVGSLPNALLMLIGMLLASREGGSMLTFGLMGLVWQALYAVVVTSSFFYRLSGIQIR